MLGFPNMRRDKNQRMEAGELGSPKGQNLAVLGSHISGGRLTGASRATQPTPDQTKGSLRLYLTHDFDCLRRTDMDGSASSC
jgi:hypothetical protein